MIFDLFAAGNRLEHSGAAFYKTSCYPSNHYLLRKPQISNEMHEDAETDARTTMSFIQAMKGVNNPGLQPH